MNTKEKAARETLANTSNTSLFDLWKATENAPRSASYVDVATVRGWIMDELEDRDPDAFIQWINSDEEPEGFFQ